MKTQIFIVVLIWSLLGTLGFAQQQSLSQNNQVKLLEQKVDSLIHQIKASDSTSEKRFKNIDEQMLISLQQTASQKLDIANVLIQWMAALLSITTIVIAIAGFIGLREFNAVRSKEREMENKLNELSEAIKKISELPNQVLNESKRLILCRHHIAQAEAFKSRGLLHESHKELVKAIEMTKETDHELRSELHLLIGNHYKMQANYVKAISELRKSIEINSNNPNAHRYLGGVYFMMNKLDEAELNLKKSLELSPDDSRVMNNLGETYVRKKEYEKAVETFLYSLELAPDFSAPCLHLGNIYRFWDQKEKSLDYFEKAEKFIKSRIDAGSTHVHNFYVLGWAKIGKGEVEEARRYMEDAFRYFPSKDTVREVIWYMEVLASSPDPPTGVNEIIGFLNEKLNT